MNSDDEDDEVRLEQEEEMGMVKHVVHKALVQMSGGRPPVLRGKPSTTIEHEEKKQRLGNENAAAATTSIMSLPEWRNFLSALCQDSINRTTQNVRDLSNGKPWDYDVRTVTSLYNRFHPKQKVNKKQRKEQRARQQLASASELVLTSDLGVERSVASAVDFSHMLLPWLDDELPRGWDIRVQASSGFILLVSPARARELRRAGRRPCPSCEVWTKAKLAANGVAVPNAAEKGLWWHQQQFHATNHATATAFAASTRVTDALLLYEEAHLWKMEELLQRRQATVKGAGGGSNHDSHHQDGLADTPAKRKAQAFQFAQDGNLSALQSAIQDKWIEPKEDVDHRGASLLLWAAGAGHTCIVQYLIEDCHCNPRQGQKQFRRGFAKRTALHWACRNGHLEVVQYLLQHCGPVVLQDATVDGTTAIGWAAWQGRLEILKWLYSLYPKEVVLGAGQVNKFGCNALLWAAQGTADTATLDWLASTAHVSLTHVNDNGHGMLHKAGQRNRQAVATWFCQRLILALQQQQQVDVDVLQNILRLIGPDQEGCTPSDLAGIEGHVDLAKEVVILERQVLEAAVKHGAKWLPEWDLDNTVLKEEWKPGCGLLRLWIGYQDLSQTLAS